MLEQHEPGPVPAGELGPDLGTAGSMCSGLDFADVMIRDWPGDNGTELSGAPGGDYTDFSEIVVG